MAGLGIVEEDGMLHLALPEQERQAGKPDAITQAFVDGAAPLLSLLFDNQSKKNSAVRISGKQQYWLVTKPLTLTLLSKNMKQRLHQ